MPTGVLFAILAKVSWVFEGKIKDWNVELLCSNFALKSDFMLTFEIL